MDRLVKGFGTVAMVCAALVMSLLLSGIASAAPVKGLEGRKPYTALTPKEALTVIEANRGNPSLGIIDVRTPEEFESGHIEGAVNINYHDDGFVDALDKLDKSKTYVVYCRTGRRSSDAVGIMKRQGFKDVYRIEGDIVRWRSEGLPLVKPTR